MTRILKNAIAIPLFAMCCFVASRPASSHELGPAPAPPTHYASLAADEGPSEQQAEAEAGKGEEEGELDFLKKDLSEISSTQVRATSGAMNAEINTVSRTAQPLARTPAAVYVVTNEMIRRCGARNIPEVLRTVPGVDVARINTCCWAISIRGLNQRFSNKLLVQIDGVPIYNPTQSTVFWQREYVMLEDVDRIEVIRGPGASVWGANAVNGVINIVTKSSKDTHGIYADAGGGNEHRQFGDFRVGGRSNDLNWRIYGFTMQDEQGYVPLPTAATDDLKLSQGGFRLDWTPSCRDTLTIEGDFGQAKDGQIGYRTPPTAGAYIGCRRTVFLTRWAREVDEDTDWAVQCSYWNPYADGYNLNTVAMFDVDFQHHMKRGRHDIVWGVDYRNNNDGWMTRGFFVFNVHDTEQWPSYFVQDTYTLVDDRLFLTLGTKLDHNSITRFEYQPTVRLAYTPDERTSLWGAVSRAVRTPSLIERLLYTPNSEQELSYELGIRRQPTEKFFWELATFFNRYDDLLAYQTSFRYLNVASADTYGFELNGTYEVNPNWRLTAWYAFLVQDANIPTGYTTIWRPGGSPRNMAYLQSGWDLGENVTFDLMFRYVDSLAMGIPAYFAGDIRLAWRPQPQLELAVVGQNLFAGNHYEFLSDAGSLPTEVEPGVYGIISWRY